MTRIPGFILVIIFIFAATGYGDHRFEWHVDASLEEEYDDNITLSPSGQEEDDFITRIRPGGNFLLEWKTGGIFLDYHLTANIYAKNSDRNFFGHSFLLDTHKDLQHNLTVRLKDVFYRADDPREAVRTHEVEPPEVVEPTEFFTGTETGERNAYNRNWLYPSIEWQYGADDRMRLGYTNRLYTNESDTIQDSMQHVFSYDIDHWFDAKNGVGFFFDYQIAQFEDLSGLQGTSDYDGQDATLIYTRRLTPHTSAFVRGNILNRSFDGRQSDYMVYRGNIGLSHAFSPRVSGTAEAGYFHWDPDIGDSQGGFDGGASLSAKWVRMQGSAYVRGGYQESFIDAENLGPAQYWSTGVAFLYEATKRMNLGIDASYTFQDFAFGGDRNTFQIRPDLSYLFLKWLTGHLAYVHLQRTGEDFSDYADNRVLFRLTARY